MTESTAPSRLPVTVSKPTPYTFDLGLLLASDPNPLILESDDVETDLASTARDGAQALLNQLLNTCPIQSTPAGVLLSLPAIETHLPREKPLPPPKSETTWSRFAAKKGIKAKSSDKKQKLVYDTATGEWVPKWGYKGSNKSGEQDWIVEVDTKAEKRRAEEGKGIEGSGMDLGGVSRKERVERRKRGERLQRANERKGRRSENYEKGSRAWDNRN